jgi:hemolysin activation/secretion protein
VRLSTPITPITETQEGEDNEILPLDEKPCFNIRSISLIGEASERFQWLLNHVDHTANGTDDIVIGHCLGTHGINVVLHRLQIALTQQGWVTTRVLVQPQELTSGDLQISVLPGRLGEIRLAPNAQGKIPEHVNLSTAFPSQSGDILNLYELEQGLENLRRVPTVDAELSIAPRPAETTNPKITTADVIVSWRQRMPLRLSLAADDSGVSSTGKYQGTTTLSYDNPFALNDLLYASYTRDLGGRDSGKRGLHASSAYYSIPFGFWLLSFNANDSQYYQTVAGANQNIVYAGASQNGEIKLSRLVYRDAYRKSTVSIKSWVRASQNYIDDTEVRVQRRRTAGWELGLNHREFIGSSTLDLSLNQRQGSGAFGARRAPEELFDEGTSRMRFTTTDIQLTTPFSLANQSLRYVGNVRAQWNQTLLVTQDRFLIGGRYSVRGFDGTNLLSADRGWLIRNEMALALGSSGHESYIGIDHGEVSGRNSKKLIGTYLTGTVWGLRGSIKGLSYDLFVGSPLSKPDGFKTSHITTGFNLNWSY